MSDNNVNSTLISGVTNFNVGEMKQAYSQIFSLVTGTPLVLDFKPLANQRKIDNIQGVWVDNSQGTDPLSLAVNATLQDFIVPAGGQGIMPLFVTADLVITLTGNGSVPIIFVNFPCPACVWPQGGGGGGGGLVIAHVTASAESPGPDVPQGANVVYVTTPGNAGASYININDPTSDAAGIGNPLTAGQACIVELAVQGDPSDHLQIYRNGNANGWVGAFQFMFEGNNSLPINNVSVDGITLDFLGAATSFIYCYDRVYWNPQYGDYNNDNANDGEPWTAGGNDGSSPGQAGGPAQLNGGNGTNGDADGGDVILQPGSGHGAGRVGLVIIENIPTADPGVSGALWSNAGVVTISP